jgi:hypothetical protein
MTADTTQPDASIEVTAEARALLLAHIEKDPARHRYVRVHVGIG